MVGDGLREGIEIEAQGAGDMVGRAEGLLEGIGKDIGEIALGGDDGKTALAACEEIVGGRGCGGTRGHGSGYGELAHVVGKKGMGTTAGLVNTDLMGGCAEDKKEGTREEEDTMLRHRNGLRVERGAPYDCRMRPQR